MSRDRPCLLSRERVTLGIPCPPSIERLFQRHRAKEQRPERTKTRSSLRPKRGLHGLDEPRRSVGSLWWRFPALMPSVRKQATRCTVALLIGSVRGENLTTAVANDRREHGLAF